MLYYSLSSYTYCVWLSGLYLYLSTAFAVFDPFVLQKTLFFFLNVFVFILVVGIV